MTADDPFDHTLRAWFVADAPVGAPGDLRATVAARSRSRRQRPTLLAAARCFADEPSNGNLLRASAFVSSVVLLLLAVAAVSGPLAQVGQPLPVESTASTRAVASGFPVPFSYVSPGDELRLVAGGMTGAISWVAGPGNPLPPGSEIAPGYGQEEAFTGNTHGVMVLTASTIWGHSPTGREPLRHRPAEFLADLHDVLGLATGPVRQTTLDGRPAFVVDVGTAGPPASHDLHLDERITGLTSHYVDLTAPYRMVAADIDGQLVLIQIWGRTQEALEQWMPRAQQFVDSIQFGSTAPSAP